MVGAPLFGLPLIVRSPVLGFTLQPCGRTIVGLPVVGIEAVVNVGVETGADAYSFDKPVPATFQNA